MAFAPCAAVRRLGAGEHPHQRGLARAVRRDERDAVAALDVQADAVEDDVVAVGLVDVRQFEDEAAALRTRRKREVDALALGRHLDRHDLVEHLDPALHLRRLRRLIAEPIDERAHPRDLVVLLLLRLAQPFHLRFALDEIARVRADVVGDRPQRQVRDARDDRVEEEPIVRDENHRVGIRDQELFEPVARVEVEVVRRLVEQQERRAAEEQLGQRDAHLPAARERLDRLVEVGAGEAKALEHLRHAQIDAVPLALTEQLADVVVANEQRLVLAVGQRRIGKRVLDAIDLGACVEQRLEGRRRLVDERSAGMFDAVLRQVADGQFCRACRPRRGRPRPVRPACGAGWSCRRRSGRRGRRARRRRRST